MTSEKTCQQIRIITKIAAWGCLASMLLCYPLWLNERIFPTSPMFAALPPIAHPLDYILLGISVLTLLIIGIIRNPQYWILLFLAEGLLMAVYDLNRWQPWFYQYMLMFFALAFFNYRCDDTKKLNALSSIFKLMIAAVYFWSGLQKFNSNFLSDTFPWLMEPITQHLGENSIKHFRMLGLAFPLIESISGIMLLINPIKKMGLVLIISMHVFILLVIGPLGHNYNHVVWPWNVAMILFSLTLFNNEEPFDFMNIRNMLRYHFTKIILILFVLLPQLNFFNLWDSYLSHNLYSGNTTSGYLYFTDSVKQQLPEQIRKYATISDKEYVIPIKYWCMKELGVPAYPEKRNFESVRDHFYKYSSDSSHIYLIVTPKTKLNDERNQ
ncbi:MAG: HTTM domain-containing protein [Bacteroidia bacterium]|nr:HTTM domain-containing protein [Bacteroidia bacterium]